MNIVKGFSSFLERMGDLFSSRWTLFIAGIFRVPIMIALFILAEKHSIFAVFGIAYTMYISIKGLIFIIDDDEYGGFFSIFSLQANLRRTSDFFHNRSKSLDESYQAKEFNRKTKHVFFEKNEFPNGYIIYRLLHHHLNHRSYPKAKNLLQELQRMVERQEAIDPIFINITNKYIPLISELQELEAQYLATRDSYKKSDVLSLLLRGLEGLADCMQKESESKIWSLNYYERKSKTLDALLKNAQESIDNGEMTLEK